MHTHHSTGATVGAGVVLDVGADVGALVIHTPAELAGREIEVSETRTGHRVHAMVRERLLGHRRCHAAVIVGLAAGTYTVWDRDRAVGGVTVRGAAVADFDWPDGQRESAAAGAD